MIVILEARFPAGDGECEIRQIAEAGDFGPDLQPIVDDIKRKQHDVEVRR